MFNLYFYWTCLSIFRVIVQASFSLFNLPLADIIDADLNKYKRRWVLYYHICCTYCV